MTKARWAKIRGTVWSLPVYSESSLRRNLDAALDDAATFGMVKIQRRGKVVGYLLKPSLYRALNPPVRPPGYFASAYKKRRRREPSFRNGVKLAPDDGVPISSKEVKSALGED